MTTAPTPVRAPRLNPFIFPSDTSFRFVLLIVAAETDRLFGIGFWDALATGAVATIAAPNLILLFGLLFPNRPMFLEGIGPALLVAPLTVGVVGVGVWRGVFASSVRRQGRTDLGRLALGLGLGMILGQLLSFYTTIGPAALSSGEPSTLVGDVFAPNLANTPYTSASLIFYGLLSALLLAGLFSLLHWIADGAAVWLEVIPTRRALRAVSILGLMIAGGLLAIYLGVLFSMLTLGMDGILQVASMAGLEVVLSWSLDAPLALIGLMSGQALPLLVMLISLWAFPLAAWFWHQRAMPGLIANWAFLDPAPDSSPMPRPQPLRLDLVLKAGLVGGVVFCIIVIIIRVSLRLGWYEALRDTDEYKIALVAGHILLAALLQVGVAAVVAARVRRLGALQSLYAAFIAGCLMTVGTLGANLAFGGTIDFAFAWLMFSQIINWGALLSLPVAVSIFTAASWVRR